jgi:hypothetical protein
MNSFSDTGARGSAGRRGRRGLTIVAVVALVLIVLAFLALALLLSRPAIVADATALARVEMPLAEGSIESVRATGPHGRTVPVAVRGGRLWPEVTLPPGEPIAIEVVLHRPGWIAWLTGSRDSAHLELRTPSAYPSAQYVTLAAGEPLKLAFDVPVRNVAYGQPEHLQHKALAQPLSMITLTRTGEAGTIAVAATSRTWERLPTPTLVSWFPAGAKGSAVTSPLPGTQITPLTPITVSFSQPVSTALGGKLPAIEPSGYGSWQEIDSHTIIYRPRGYGFGLDTGVTLNLPRQVRLIDGHDTGSSSEGAWSVPGGSTLRAQEILAQLGYLPLTFDSSQRVDSTPAAQEVAAVYPPQGSFSWRYPNAPSTLRALWSPGTSNMVTRGAVMAFENAHEMTTDGIVGPSVWRALIRAEIGDQRTSAGYTFVMVSESSETLHLWNDGSIRLTTPVNTGIASAPTELGTFAVYEHIASGTMSGTNPDGSHYEDPGVPWISYFNGGDALHGFERAQYGFPQSLGCVEMLPATAGEVWPYTPIGTLVHIE